MIDFNNFKWFRKFKGGIWYKHELTLDAAQIMLTPGITFWARYGHLNRYSKVVDKESY